MNAVDERMVCLFVLRSVTSTLTIKSPGKASKKRVKIYLPPLFGYCSELSEMVKGN